jgi:deazaflavin-dependent oxidoreductase (nitroreductase family)
MDPAIEEALSTGGIVDLTTTGRKSGLDRRIEVYLHNFDGHLYLTGRPGFPRDWVANIGADPNVTLHLKRGVVADLPAKAKIISEPAEKGRIILRARVESWGVDPEKANSDMDHWVATAPAVRLTIS